ncbi:hypothetical protein [Methanoregula sp.]|jgi:hypothetical protein|uniref:hypothetical protein n=1 Tax=Methanoregula sp. TaxID=2052170 RepID=UPI003C21C008
MKSMFNPSNLHWSNYFLKKGEDFQPFWKLYLEEKERKLLYVIGIGFDLRMCLGLDALVNSTPSINCDCISIEYHEGASSPSKKHADKLEHNRGKLNVLLKKCRKHTPKKISMWSDDGRPIGDIKSKDIISNIGELLDYTDIIVDISALPKNVYFPLIGKILYLIDDYRKDDSTKKVPNFHIIVAESAIIDRKIIEVDLITDAFFLRGFTSGLENESAQNIPTIWIPILGEQRKEHLKGILKKVTPDEIWPVLPSPSIDPRRGDNLLLEYRDFLFDQENVEPRNIIYASEKNPFDLYRQIHRIIHYNNEALRPLGGCKVAISPLSSKLLSIGALLAVYELKKSENNVAIALIVPQGYNIEEISEEESNQIEIFSLLLIGV